VTGGADHRLNFTPPNGGDLPAPSEVEGATWPSPPEKVGRLKATYKHNSKKPHINQGLA